MRYRHSAKGYLWSHETIPALADPRTRASGQVWVCRALGTFAQRLTPVGERNPTWGYYKLGASPTGGAVLVGYFKRLDQVMAAAERRANRLELPT